MKQILLALLSSVFWLSALIQAQPVQAQSAQARPVQAPPVQAQPVQAQPLHFDEAKVALRQQVYHDQNEVGDFYCDCQWRWVGRSAGRMIPESCSFRMRAQTHRAARLEWEHVVPAHNFGMARRCWQEGGRSHCQKTDPLFGRMEADLHNLVPAVGEINADRSNYRFGMLPDAEAQHGGCDFRVNFKRRVVEPRDAVKGQVARIYLYMHQRYYLPMSESQRRLFQAWHTRFPVTDWERERDRRIKAITGVSNPFVVGSDAQSQSQSPVPVAHE